MSAVEQNNAQCAGVSIIDTSVLSAIGVGGGVSGKPPEVESEKHPISSYGPAGVSSDGTSVGP